MYGHVIDPRVVNPHIKFTYDHYAALPDDGRRYELWDGDLVLPPSSTHRHQDLIGNLYFALRGYLATIPTGAAVLSPFDVRFSDVDVVQPDLLFVSDKRRSILTSQYCNGAPDIVVQILSSDEKRDRDIKRNIYSRFGVPEYWIVDPKTRTIDVLRDPERGYQLVRRYEAGESLQSPTLPGFSAPLDKIFAP